MEKMGDFDWVVGFIDATGCFTQNEIKIARKTEKETKIYRYSNPVFFITNNDPSPLEIIRRTLRVGKVVKVKGYFRFEVRRKGEVLKLTSLLEGRLRSEEKQRAFEKWKQWVLQWKSRGRTNHK